MRAMAEDRRELHLAFVSENQRWTDSGIGKNDRASAIGISRITGASRPDVLGER